MTAPEEKEKNKEAYRERTRKQTRKVLIYSGIFLLVLLTFFSVFDIAWGLIGVHINSSEGDRVAKIIKVSERGWIWKTWEAEAVLTQGDLVTTYIWRFSIDAQDPNEEQLLTEVRRAFESGELIKMHYDERAGTVPWRSKTNYFLKDVRFSNEGS